MRQANPYPPDPFLRPSQTCPARPRYLHRIITILSIVLSEGASASTVCFP
jgi:hypothetical protein